MFSHWFLNSTVLDVRSMASQTYTECILRFSDVLNGTSFALNQVHHVPRSTVGSGFHTKLCALCRAVKYSAHFYMGTCFTEWMFTGTVTLVRLPLLFQLYPHLKVFQIRRAAICYKGTLWKCFSQRGDISMTHWWSWRMPFRWGRFGEGGALGGGGTSDGGGLDGK